ncbi:hypothetical protein HZA57_04030 [Candidatus Poribacteria bacterium]|nr:hypothetical protein [Candidatus Poribacteria bacterium]
MTRRTVVLVMLAAVVALLFSSASAQIPPGGNQFCPVTEGLRADPGIWADYEGRRIYFSSETARELFEFSPEDYIANLGAPGSAESGEELPERFIEPEEPPAALRLAGHAHPLVVHFPVAMLIGAALAELISLRFRREEMRAAARFCLAVGAAGAAAAAAPGWLLALTMEFSDGMDVVLMLHRWVGVATAVSALVCLDLSERAQKAPAGSPHRAFYLVTLFGTAGLVAVAGHFGGTLVFGPGYFLP